MAQKKYNIKKRTFQHLTSEKRAQIGILLNQGVAKTEIAKAVGISRDTLYRELERGTVEQIDTNLKRYKKYFWEVGQRVYEENRKNCKPSLKLMKSFKFINYAEKQILEHKLSPDAICGEAKRSRCFDSMACTKTPYNYINKWLLNVKNPRSSAKSKEKDH